MKKSEIKKLDALFRQVIRTRDVFCQRCGKRKNLQTCHMITRSNRQTRWKTWNGILLCASCHIFWAHKYPNEFIDFMRKRLGDNRYDYLRLKSRLQSKVFYDEVKQELEARLEALQKR